MGTVASDHSHSLVQVSKPLISQRIDHRVRRTWTFSQQDDQEPARNSLFACISMGAAAGAVCGAEMGRKIEGIFQAYNHENVDEEDNHLGGFLGKIAGGVIGGTLGLLGGVKYIESLPDYKKWVGRTLNKALKDFIDSEYKNDAILEIFCCPVTHCYMYQPVHVPSGHIFDLSSILNCKLDPNGMITHPLNCASIRKSDLIDDHEMAFIIWKRVHFLMKKSIAEKAPSDERTFLENYLKEIEKDLTQDYNHARDNIELRRKKKIVSSQAYEEEISEFKALFGVDENQEMDWSKDWKALLIQRWKYFHPGTKVFFIQ